MHGSHNTESGNQVHHLEAAVSIASAAAAIGKPEAGTASRELAPDGAQLARFSEAVFKNANRLGFVSLRAFLDKDDTKKDDKPIFVTPINLGDPQYHALLVERARQAATWPKSAVFCPPVVTFRTGKDAKTENIFEGVTLPVECDQAPVAAWAFLRELLGDPTIIVASGGEWTNPETGEVEPKVHIHWRLKVPTRTKEEHGRLKEARELAAKLVGADTSAVPLVHPLRWPGSWHRKKTPRLAEIAAESDNEIDLDEALDILREAMGAAATPDPDVFDLDKPKTRLAKSIDDVVSALGVIPNDNLKWEYWNKFGMATWAATDGSAEGGKAFADWSAKAEKNDKAATDARWKHYATSPPDRLGFGSLIYHAQRADPSWRVPSWGKPAAPAAPADPVDLWAKFDPPSLPRGLLPDIIERFAFDQGVDTGADMAGIAVAALAVCAAAIPDKVKLQVKRNHAGWLESARLWVALVGPPSTMKTPSMAAAVRPLRKIDAAMARKYAENRAIYDKLDKEAKAQTNPPRQVRLMMQDTTIEAAQEILKDSPDGLLCFQDEMTGFFGAIDKYSNARGAAKDRAFWLEAYNGNSYSVNRIGRGASYIENLSISVLGGMQPEPLRKIMEDAVDDGLLQRLLAIIVKSAVVGRDEVMSEVVAEYAALIERLHELEDQVLQFDAGAQQCRQELERKHLDLQACEVINRRLSAHIGKYNGIFARLCIIFHCVENCRKSDDLDFNYADVPATITEKTARRVAAFLHSFLLPHAVAFHVGGVMGLSDDHDRLIAVAGYILSHKLDRITNRDIQRGDRTMRNLSKQDTERIFEQLDALGWINRIPAPRPSDPPHWVVNPAVHTVFAARAAAERERRERERKIIAGMIGGKT
jgi:Protein of unknown function (DUF3987)/Primase C terminal 2 (PriCT-2)